MLNDHIKAQIKAREARRRAPEERWYPAHCQSAYCGRTECGGCRHEPELRAFKEWRERTGAYQPDHIWSPSLWVACKEV